MTNERSNILVTGGCGFIGSNFINYLFKKTSFKGKIVNIDKFTYAGSRDNLDISSFIDRYKLIVCDIRFTDIIDKVCQENNIDIIVHFAAESHVDRSILSPLAFVDTNVNGTLSLLEVARKHNIKFHHVSTDEVYGSLKPNDFFTEESPYHPNSPYSASKASSDHFVRAYHATYNLPITISNCSNNYGPYQTPEKLIPLMILNALENKGLPIYGDGSQVRDWLYVEDHCIAIWSILNLGTVGETYLIGGDYPIRNIDIIDNICTTVNRLKKDEIDRHKLKKFVKDRPGHDQRYAINCTKIKFDLIWKRTVNFDEGLTRTVKWYMDNPEWVNNAKLRIGEWIKLQY